MEVDVDYIAAGGNRHSSAADWGDHLLAFGAGNNIALWDPEAGSQKGVSSLLAGHTGTVNTIKILKSAGLQIIISGGADQRVRLWHPTNADRSYEQSQCLDDHKSSLNVISSSPDGSTFTTASADGIVLVWSLREGQAKLMQSISLKPRYVPLASAICVLSDGVIALAVAGTTSTIQVFVRANADQGFELQAALTGHEGWIRSLDFVREGDDEASDLLLASGSQDKYIRLWRFRREPQASLPGSEGSLARKSLSNRAHLVGAADYKYAVTFEALLIGHEDWVYSTRWAPKIKAGQLPCLLSASADNSLSVWAADEASGVWVCNTRMGEISAQKGSTTATGSAGGFWTGLWQPNGLSVACLGRTGSWRRWCFEAANDSWVQRLGISGHTKEVRGLAWAPDGSYLITTSSDQTTRLFADWRRNGTNTWHEFARPQIHGYDLNCIDVLNANQFISGADEKLLRVFDKPRAVDHLLSKLSGIESTVSNELASTADIPVLGLSNKAVPAIANDDVADGDEEGGTRSPTLTMEHPPFEDLLARHTLWPEHEKLYGHGYEISAVAASNDGSLVATACKASSVDHAVIRLFETKDWREIKPPLTAHSLTITSLAFSDDDRYLLSVGRDRQWSVFMRNGEVGSVYEQLASSLKGHARMILDGCWAPQKCGHVFATAGRDKVVKIWRLEGSSAQCVTTLTAPTSATAVAMSLMPTDSTSLCVAVGCENGAIQVATLDCASLEVKRTQALAQSVCPTAGVNRLCWRPQGNLQLNMRLAIASDDHSVRILGIGSDVTARPV